MNGVAAAMNGPVGAPDDRIADAVDRRVRPPDLSGEVENPPVPELVDFGRPGGAGLRPGRKRGESVLHRPPRPTAATGLDGYVHPGQGLGRVQVDTPVLRPRRPDHPNRGDRRARPAPVPPRHCLRECRMARREPRPWPMAGPAPRPPTVTARHSSQRRGRGPRWPRRRTRRRMGAGPRPVFGAVVLHSSVEERMSAPDLAVELPISGRLPTPRPDLTGTFPGQAPKAGLRQDESGPTAAPPPVTGWRTGATGCRTGARTGLATVVFTTPPAVLVTTPPTPGHHPDGRLGHATDRGGHPAEAAPTTGRTARGGLAGRYEVAAEDTGAGVDEGAPPVEADEVTPAGSFD